MKPNASEFTGIVPLSDHPNLDPSVNYQIDLLRTSKGELLLHTLDVGDHIAVNAMHGILHFEVAETIEEERAGQKALVLPDTTFEKLNNGDCIQVHGAICGGSMLRLGVIAVGKQLEITKASKSRVTEKFIENEKLTTEMRATLRRIGHIKQDEEGEYITKWRRMTTGTVLDIHNL